MRSPHAVLQLSVRGLRAFSLLVALGLCLSASASAQQPRFEAVRSRTTYFAPIAFAEASGAAASGTSGQASNVLSNTVLRIPHRASSDDTFIYAFEHAYDAYFFGALRREEPFDAPRRGPAFGDPLSEPFEALQILRALWTWQHSFESGYNLYLHNRTGLHGSELRFDPRWIRVGAALAIERQWSARHLLGGGVIGLFGIGAFDPIPFVRYEYWGRDVRVWMLLPLYARFYAPVASWAELGLVLEADGNRYRVEGHGLPFDNVDVVYSYWGPSMRLMPFEALFVTADVGLTALRVLDLYYDRSLVSELELGSSPVVSLTLGWEPSY